MSVTVTVEMVERAKRLAMPSIRAMQADGIAKRSDGYLIIGTGGTGRSRGILCRLALGESSEWEHPYDWHAAQKYEITHAHGVSTREVHERYPERIAQLSTPYKGSAINVQYGIIVAFSGVDECIDEAIAGLVMEILVGLVRHAEMMAGQQPATSD